MLRYSAGFLLFGATLVNGDCYLHNPKGCNNRLNEKSANRNNANRIFDSQNNNRGGYNAADLDDTNGASANNPYATMEQMYNVEDFDNVNRQYNMMYIEGSMMRMSYTNQHGCNNPMNNCNLVIQMGCDTHSARNPNQNNNNINFNQQPSYNGNGGLPLRGLGTRMMILNGGNTNAPGDANINNNDNVANKLAEAYNNNNDGERGRHESEEYYEYCKSRTRNEGLFTADQKLKGNNQINTRQNPNGNRSGLECPEERDYFPWEFPTPFIDLAWKGNDVEYCKKNIAPFSQRVYPKGTCTGGGANPANSVPNNDAKAATNAQECDDLGGVWATTQPTEEFTEAWAEAFCQEQPFTQVNHLGNADQTSKGGQMDSTEWWIPKMAQLEDWGCHTYSETVNGQTRNFVGAMMRIRYNISTMDYDPYTTDASFNNDPQNGVISPVQQNPTVDVGAWMQGLQLALNTAQTGRVFQDRTHKFYIAENLQTPGTGDLQFAENNILNVNVRGKRGNIVQTFPAVEYDFEPNDIVLVQGQCIHLQWAGSNTHNNGNPAGDGQAGDAGEGRGGSDRSNLMEMQSLRQSYPMTYDQHTSFFDTAKCKYPLSNQWLTTEGAKIVLATAGYYHSKAAADGTNQGQQGGTVDPLLDNVSGAFRQGLICCPQTGNINNDPATPPGDYYFLSTRNNNFSNRAQKAKIKVVQATGADATRVGTAKAFEFYPTENVELMNKKYPTNRRRGSA